MRPIRICTKQWCMEHAALPKAARNSEIIRGLMHYNILYANKNLENRDILARDKFILILFE
jgi:hypothetical protein